MKIFLLLLILTTASFLWAVMRGSLIRAAIALAAASALLAIIMFHLGAPLAAVFELSVCAGLITVVFISTISLTEPHTHEETLQKAKVRIKRFWFLPVIVVALIALLAPVATNFSVPEVFPDFESNASVVLWKLRHVDVFGQIAVLLTGVFGVVVFFLRKDKN